MKDNNFYEQYLRSDQWKHKRLLRLKIDKFQCRTCRNIEDLEVHHLSYKHLGNEPLEDLITLCRFCHEAITNSIRERRYKNTKDIEFSNCKERQLTYVETTGSEVEWSSTTDYAQRRTCESPSASSEGNEESLFKTFQDRFRFRTNGKA